MRVWKGAFIGKRARLLVSLGAILTSLIVCSQAVFAEDSLTISLSADSVAMTLMPDIFGSASQTITAATTSEYGYTITMKTAGTTTGLVNVGDDTLSIPTISLSSGATTVPVASFGYGYGYSVDGGTNFKPAPEVTSEEGDTLFKTSVAGENTHTLTWGAKVAGDTPAGTYQNNFTIAVTANPASSVLAEYNYPDQITFDGTNYLDTGIALFSTENVHKDFVVSFTVDAIDETQNGQAVLFADMDETGSPYPGVLFRMVSGKISVIANANAQTNDKALGTDITNLVMKRESGVVSYSVDGGETFTVLTDYEGFTHPFDVTATFGAGKNNKGDPFRYFKGTLSNISVVLKEPENYKIVYDLQGGSGDISNRVVANAESVQLTTTVPTKPYYIFSHWNTAADDSGTTYQSGDTVSGLAALGETAMLYAIWENAPRYSITYHSNTDPEETDSQDFVYSVEQTLTANTFTSGTLVFAGWNTRVDGSGNYYHDEQSVLNLTDVDGTVINLYAMWADESYVATGETAFNGTSEYIDTGIYLFNDANVDRDFVISFEITTRTSTSGQATIMSAMDESGNPWPGMVYRVNNKWNNDFITNVTSSKKKTLSDSASTTQKVQIRRAGGVIYLKINDDAEQTVIDTAALVHTFDSPVVFGASLQADGTSQRYFEGTLSNMKVYVIEEFSVSSNLATEASEPTSEQETVDIVAESEESATEEVSTEEAVALNDDSLSIAEVSNADDADNTDNTTADSGTLEDEYYETSGRR